MRLLYFASLIFLFACSPKANIEEQRKEYDSLTLKLSINEKALNATKDVYESMKYINPDSTNLYLLRRIEEIKGDTKKIESRRSELSKEIFGK